MPDGLGVQSLSFAGEGSAPPVDLISEQAFLGAGLVRNEIFEDALGSLEAEHFADPLHGRIYASALALIARGMKVTPITLGAEFDRDPALKEIGGAQYLVRLAASVLSVESGADCGRVIRDLATRRDIIEVAEDVRQDATDLTGGKPAAEVLNDAAQRLHEIGTGVDGARPLLWLNEAAKDALECIERAFKEGTKISGVPTGLADLDRATGGLQAGNLVILAGRPGMGKSDLAVTIALGAARAGRTVQLFSQEMTAAELSQRVLTGFTGIAADRQRRGAVDLNDIERLVAAEQDLKALKVIIDESPCVTVTAMRQRARRLQRQQGLGLIIVDHLQLMRSGDRRRQENRVQEITEITRGLKELAKELGVPALVLSQLNRAVEAREDKRPNLADLRESGSIEQDADAVIFLYRSAYYLQREEPQKRSNESAEGFEERQAKWVADLRACSNLAELHLAKQRFGPVRTVRLYYEPERSRFSNLAHGEAR